MPTLVIVLFTLLFASFISVALPEEASLHSLSHLFSQNQSGCNVLHLRIGTGTLTVEIADTPKQMAIGLAFRPNLAPDMGMLFIHKGPQRVVYNSHNTLIPLSCAFIDADGFILEIHDLPSNSKTTATSKTDQIKFVVEANQGWFEQHTITPGTRIMITDKQVTIQN